MILVFEDGGKIAAGRVIASQEASCQVELPGGKRLKVKAQQQLLRVDREDVSAFFESSQNIAGDMDVQLVWEFAPDTGFDFAGLAQDYFGQGFSPQQQVASLLCLHQHPHYFRRQGKGRFCKADAETLAQALAAIARKKQAQELMDSWAQALQQGALPPEVAQDACRILFRPDKNTPTWKAVAQAAFAQRLSMLEVLQKAGAFPDVYAFHWQRFLLDQFEKGTQFPAFAWEAPDVLALPAAQVSAFSIDDRSTTEIDDALSVQGLGSHRVVLGIHIAAPAWGMTPGEAVDALAYNRQSTVYMPGHKLTMLPHCVGQAFSLDAAALWRPALSLYTEVDASSMEVLETRTVLERICVKENLRLEDLEGLLNADTATVWHEQPGLPFARELQWLHAWATHRKGVRELQRGKPEKLHQTDYNFLVEGVDPAAGPRGDEVVRIVSRLRGAPADLIVSEAMIWVNSTWGAWMARWGVPAIYRNQASLAPGVKVRMGTKALAHAGMGVDCYAWCSSPLRRYVDLVNQWQLLACVAHGNAAALQAPFRPRDTALMAVVSRFEQVYQAYGSFQKQMECFWTLRYVQQNALEVLQARVVREGMPLLARAESLPLMVECMLPSHGLPRVPCKGETIRLRLSDLDEMSLQARGVVMEIVDSGAEGEGSDQEPGEEEEDVEDTLKFPVQEEESAQLALGVPQQGA